MLTIGSVIDTRRYVPGRRSAAAPSLAFDVEGRPLGTFPDRRTAMRAVGARHDFEGQHPTAGNLAPEPVSLRNLAKAAERDWKRTLPTKERKTLPPELDILAGPSKVRVRQPSADKSKAAYLRYLREGAR